MAPPTTIAPVAEREVYIIKEATPGTIPASIGSPVPVTSFKPSDKPIWIKDESMQGSMGDNYGVYQGPLIGGLDIGGHVTPDLIGHFLYNLLGDYTVGGTAAAPSGTTNAPLAVGASNISVASGGASFTNGMQLWLQDAGTPAANEIVTVTSGSTATNIPLSTPTRFAHLTAMPFTNTTSPYTHVFALLNGSIGAANGPAQGPTHCITDRQGLTANGAAQYAYCCLSELTFTGNAEKLFDWTAKTVCYPRSAAGSPVGTTNVSTVQPYPSWRSVTGVGGPASGGTQRKEIAEWAFTLARAVKPFNTNQGSQLPYVIARGKQTTSGKMTVLPAIDESYVVALLANTQPQLQVVESNGLGGANSGSVQFDVLQAAYVTSDLQDGAELFGYEVPWDGVHTAANVSGITMTGASGGKGAIKVTLINAVPTY